MEVKRLEGKGNKIKLLFKGVDTPFMNGLRRTAMAGIPVIAIEDVTFFENDSPISDEMLAHRLGMLPIESTKEIKEGDEFSFTLQKEGPGTVYAKDIQGKDPKTKIAASKTPITELDKKQSIKLEMKAIAGKGSQHAKWQAGIISYKNLPKITVDEDCEKGKSIVDSCPVNVLELRNKKVVLADAPGCTLCGNCRDTCKEGHVHIDYQQDQFVVDMESHGGIENERILLKSIEVLQEKAQSFKKALKSRE